MVVRSFAVYGSMVDLEDDLKKVLHIQKVAGIAGSENHLLTLLPQLREYGYELRMLVLAAPEDRPGAFIKQMHSHGIVTNVIPMRGNIAPFLVIRLAYYIRRHNFNLIHTHLFHADLYGTLAARLAGVQSVVSTKHGFDPWRRGMWYGFLDRRIAFLQEHIIVISKAIGQWLSEVEGLPKSKMRVVHYAIDVDGFRADTPSKKFSSIMSQPIIGIVSRLIHQKGVQVLIEALGICIEKYPETSLVIVGDGPCRSVLEQQAQTLGIAENVHFLGYVVHPELNSIMQAFDIFAFPTFGEGFGLVLLEAMACAKPIIASEVMAIPEIVLHEECGLLVPPGDPVLLAEALQKLLQDSDLRQQYGDTGFRRVTNEFTVKRMARQTARVYGEMLGVSNEIFGDSNIQIT